MSGEEPRALVVRRRIDAGHRAFDGHFPGRPMLPGVAVLAEVMEIVRATPAIAVRIGAAPRLGVVKFVSPVPPDSTIEITLRDGATAVAFSVARVDGPDDTRIVATGQFGVAGGEGAR